MNKTLNELAQEFAVGKLDKAQYREARKELLSKILTGDVEVKTGEYLSPEEGQGSQDADITKPSSRDISEKTENNEITQIKIPEKENITRRANDNKPASNSTAKKINRNKKRFLLFSLILIILLTAITVLFYPSPPLTNNGQNLNLHSEQATFKKPTHNIITNNLIDTFLSKNIWTDESLNSFLTNWNSLGEDEISKLLNSASIELMRKALYEQYLQEKAFSSIDPEKAKLRQEKLIYIAQSLGLEGTFDNIR